DLRKIASRRRCAAASHNTSYWARVSTPLAIASPNGLAIYLLSRLIIPLPNGSRLQASRGRASVFPRTFVSSPLISQSIPWADKLAEAPLNLSSPIFVSWLGVVQYLRRDDILGTLRAIASWAGRSEIALTYVNDDWVGLAPDEMAAM